MENESVKRNNHSPCRSAAIGTDSLHRAPCRTKQGSKKGPEPIDSTPAAPTAFHSIQLSITGSRVAKVNTETELKADRSGHQVRALRNCITRLLATAA